MKEKEVYTKSYWDEEDMFIYNHFIGDIAVRQINVRPNSIVCLTLEKHTSGDDDMLYDQTLEELNLKESEFITEEEFDTIWREP